MHEDPIESNQMEGTVRWVEWHAWIGARGSGCGYFNMTRRSEW
jgi:hypothetical protein